MWSTIIIIFLLILVILLLILLSIERSIIKHEKIIGKIVLKEEDELNDEIKEMLTVKGTECGCATLNIERLPQQGFTNRLDLSLNIKGKKYTNFIEFTNESHESIQKQVNEWLESKLVNLRK